METQTIHQQQHNNSTQQTRQQQHNNSTNQTTHHTTQQQHIIERLEAWLNINTNTAYREWMEREIDNNFANTKMYGKNKKNRGIKRHN